MPVEDQENASFGTMRNFTTRSFFRHVAVGLVLAASAFGVQAKASTTHLTKAQLLVNNLRAQGERGVFNAPNGKLLNEYGASWNSAMIAMGGPARCYGRCASFLTLMLMISYPGWSARGAGFDSASPDAAMYHDAINDNLYGFAHVNGFSNTLPGDILAVKYSEPDGDSGHIMMVLNATHGQADANGVMPWTVEVIDCSKNTHSDDTRNFNYLGIGTYSSTGAGRGKILVYTQNDEIVGYAWSLANGSQVYLPADRNMTVGRFTPNIGG